MRLFKSFTILLILLPAVSFADSWMERPDLDFHAHPLRDIVVLEKSFARGEIVDVLRAANFRQSGLIKVVMASGRHRGKVVYAKNIFRGPQEILSPKKGDNVVLSYFDRDEPEEVFIDGYDRTGMIVLLLAIFIGIVLLVGGRRSFYSLLALGGGLLLIKFLLVPAILAGWSPVFWTVVVVVAIVVATMVAIGGFSRKSSVAIIGTLSGLGVVFLLGYLFYNIANISGFHLEEIQLLNYFSGTLKDVPVSFFRNFLIAILVLGASGVIMDIGISVASSMKEMALHSPGINSHSLYKGGIAVGRDIVATMSNTLILAYLGSSLGSILVMSLHVETVFQMFNMQFFHVEFYYAVLGSTGFLVAAYVTAIVGGRRLRDG